MKLSELIEIAKTKPTTPIYLYPDNYTIFEDSDLQPTYIEDPEERLRSNYIKKWYDSDDCVGIQAVFLDGEFIACIAQTSRKSNEQWYFKDEEAAFKLKNYILSFMGNPSIGFLDEEMLEDDFGDSFTLQYASQPLHNKAMLDNIEVEVLHPKCRNLTDLHTIIIRKPNGELDEVDVRKLKFAYCA